MSGWVETNEFSGIGEGRAQAKHLLLTSPGPPRFCLRLAVGIIKVILVLPETVVFFCGGLCGLICASDTQHKYKLNTTGTN